METEGTPHLPAKEKRAHWLRVLRPLILWCGLVVVLFLLRTHERLLERTRLVFNVSFQGQEFTGLGEYARLDKRLIASGSRIALGSHVFTIFLPKAEPFQTNLFVWYGTNNLGTILLNRAKGTLNLALEPKAKWVWVEGPEYHETFNDCANLNLTLPTDTYTIVSHYANWQQEDRLTIFDRQTNTWRVAPRLGALAFTCNKEDATFELIGPDNRTVQTSGFPITVADLPEGKYLVRTRHHKYEWDKHATVKAGNTNEVAVQLDYGRLVLKADPAVASVKSSDGRDWGRTPLTIEEIPAGTWTFTFDAYGYEPATAFIEIKTKETVSFFTNLVSRNYTAEISSAKQYFESGDYDRAAEAAGNALLAKQDDPVALQLRRESVGLTSLRRAKLFGDRGDYIAGVKELERTADRLPDNAEVLRLMPEFKTGAAAQKEKLRVERLNRGKAEMDKIVSRYPDSELFETHELKSSKPVKEVQAAIVSALQKHPAFKIARHEAKGPETYFIDARQELQTYLQTSAGRRQCLIVASQITDEETQILFKVLEYKAEAVEKFSVGALIGAPVEVKYVPIHESRIFKMSDTLKLQISGGVSNVNARIRNVLNAGESVGQFK